VSIDDPAVELVVEHATLNMPLPELGVGDVVKAEGFYEVHDILKSTYFQIF